MNPYSFPAYFSALRQFRRPTKGWYHTQWVCLLTLINIMVIISLLVLNSVKLTTLTITDLDTTHHKTLLGRVCIHATPALRRQRREGCEFQAGLDYIHNETLCEKKPKILKHYGENLFMDLHKCTDVPWLWGNGIVFQ